MKAHIQAQAALQHTASHPGQPGDASAAASHVTAIQQMQVSIRTRADISMRN